MLQAAAVGRTKSAKLRCFWMADRGAQVLVVGQSTMPTTAVRKPTSWLRPYTNIRKVCKTRWRTSWPLQKRRRLTGLLAGGPCGSFVLKHRYAKCQESSASANSMDPCCFLRFLSATRLLSPSACSLVRLCTSAHSCMTSCDNQGL